MDGDRVLVTGAGGMIGGAVVAHLHAAGALVRAHVGPEGFAGGPLPPGVESHRCDVLDIAPLLTGIDVVVHLAGPPGVAASFADPAHYLRDHVLGTAAVLAALGPARLVHISSAEVYGRPAANPVAESAPTVPLSPYGVAKLGAEALVRALRPEATILRPFSVYGPRSPAYSLVGTIARQATGDGAIELADLTPIRDYVHVDDLARAVARCVREPAPGTFNIGSGVGTSVAELVRLLTIVVGRDRPITSTGPDRPVDVVALVADTSRTWSELGWAAEIDLTVGLAGTVAAQPT
jgi:nucleoside-diphosphate-sugar epimerase